MGGHGALTLYLSSLASSSKIYRSASAFAPIANPTKCPWGTKAFSGYLQGGVEEGNKWDATVLLGKVQGQQLNILVDYVSIQLAVLCDVLER
jgi:S-formylglutathione hydrolase